LVEPQRLRAPRPSLGNDRLPVALAAARVHAGTTWMPPGR